MGKKVISERIDVKFIMQRKVNDTSYHFPLFILSIPIISCNWNDVSMYT